MIERERVPGPRQVKSRRAGPDYRDPWDLHKTGNLAMLPQSG
jgi:hypothetical protein